MLSALEVLDTVLLRVMVDDVAVGRAIGWLEPDCASLLRAGDHIKQTEVHRKDVGQQTSGWTPQTNGSSQKGRRTTSNVKLLIEPERSGNNCLGKVHNKPVDRTRATWKQLFGQVHNELVDQTRTTWKQLFGQVHNELVDQTRTTWKQLLLNLG